MRKKIVSTIIAAFFPVLAWSADETTYSGEMKAGYQHLAGGDSAKFNEYRDIKDGLYLYRLNLGLLDRPGSRYIDLAARNLFRDDQNVLLATGKWRKWRFELEWDETPHLISTKAKTPYNYQGDGIFTVPSTAGVDMSTAGASTAKDSTVASYLSSNLHDTELGTQREKARISYSMNATPELAFKIPAGVERKEGFEVPSAAIGDRPPRALNTQISEPVDYSTKELSFKTDYAKENYQVQFSYLLSAFDNDNDSLTWNNIFYDPTSGNTTTVEDGATDRTYSTVGRTALYPDNLYQNFTLTTAFNLPKESRLDATVSYSRFDQNENLLPYSYSALGTDWDSASKLPRTSAEAELSSTYLKLNYSIIPVQGLGLHGFYNYYGLENGTNTDEWYYVTQDASSNTSGGTNVNNQRKNLAYDYAKQNYGVDAYYPFKGYRFGLGYEREEIGRDFRESDTSEDIFKASLSTQLAKILSLKLKYHYGIRDGSGYNGEVTDESYHFSNAAESGSDRPVSAFSNHPDLRKFDVADRKRSQFDISAAASPRPDLSFSASYSFREDDFDSDVTSTQPLAGTGFAAEAGVTPGDQLGLLKDRRDFYTVDASYRPEENITLSVFFSREILKQVQRGMAVDENARTTSATWAVASNQWMAEVHDKTNTFGAAAGYVIIPEKLNLAVDYTYSYGTVAIDYTGYGSDQPLTTTYYAFSNPDKVSHRNHVIDATLEYKAMKNLVVGLSYLYDRYKVKDWMQEATGDWVEEVGSEFFLRDETEDNRWGNRLVTLGSLLGPSYEAHVGMLSAAYKF